MKSTVVETNQLRTWVFLKSSHLRKTAAQPSLGWGSWEEMPLGGPSPPCCLPSKWDLETINSSGKLNAPEASIGSFSLEVQIIPGLHWFD